MSQVRANVENVEVNIVKAEDSFREAYELLGEPYESEDAQIKKVGKKISSGDAHLCKSEMILGDKIMLILEKAIEEEGTPEEKKGLKMLRREFYTLFEDVHATGKRIENLLGKIERGRITVENLVWELTEIKALLWGYHRRLIELDRTMRDFFQ
jgi:predicted RNase H-like nuclease (RuvC/YqgF family)